jgi:predicted O-methyltransferase YrrM
MTAEQWVIPPHPKPTSKETFFRLLWRALGKRPSLDAFLTSQLKHRHYLPVVEPTKCIPLFEESEIKLRRCPVGAWSTPLIDVYVVIKAVIGFNSRRVLELGSFRGDTARLIAENTPDNVRICTVDVNPDHGASYRNTPLESRIDRKIGRITPQLFAPGEEYDFIFVDADHDYKSVMNDTMVALRVLSPQGVIFWHDYDFSGYFHGMAGIPETLKYFSDQHAIVSLQSTRLAMCSRYPNWETSKLVHQPSAGAIPAGNSVWQDTQVRG